jgi:succinate dehydrogenase / fumarate reductase, flavoprotein subunit
MKIFPAVHYTMGGLYTTFTPEERAAQPGDKIPRPIGMKNGDPGNMVTNIPGLYAFGEANYQYHGANRLGANALLNCIFDGIFCGLSVANYVKDVVKTPAADLPASLFQPAVAQEQARVEKLIASAQSGGTSGGGGGGGNPYTLHQQLGQEMTEACTVVREESRMRKALDQVQSFKEQYRNVRISDTGTWTNQNLSFTRALGDMLAYGEAILAGAIARKESRGAHYRLDYPNRDDANFLKTTLVKYDKASDKPVLSYEPVTTPLIQPRGRTYGKVEAAANK